MSIDAGMDVAEVEALSYALRDSADRLSLIAQRLDRVVRNAGWQGQLASSFKDKWWPGHRTRLAQVAGDLNRLSQLAFKQAAEQRAASDDGPGSSGSATVGTVGSSAIVRQLDDLKSPAEVRAWWDALSESDRRVLMSDRPDLIGNLDGVPPEVRYAANRSNIQDAIDQLTAAGAPNGRIDALKALLAPGRQVLLFDPRGDGRIAEVFGDLATADDIAVVVPGIGTSLANYSPEYAKNIHDAKHGDTATIMWVGYDTPSAPKDLNPLDPSAVSAGRAKEWAPTLVSFTEGLRAHGHGEISIVAHSYGTVLATEAAKAGMKVERVLLLGSPGVPADNAAVFNGAHVFAGKNPLDYVPVGSTHGTDPTSSAFGASGVPSNPPKPGVLKPWEAFDHSSYFRTGSPSLGGIVRAIEGSRRGADGMVVNRYVRSDGSAEDVWTGTF